jgi:mannonate dehydratase
MGKRANRPSSDPEENRASGKLAISQKCRGLMRPEVMPLRCIVPKPRPMQLSVRWYGPDDGVRLDQIRQVPGVEHVVSALYDVPPGQAWPKEDLARLKERIEDAGLRFSAIESIPVHEDIKLGRPGRERYIDNYARSVERAGALGIEVVCYNFMPVFDWTRTDLAHRLPDGSEALAYDHADLSEFDFSGGTGELPAWASYSRVELEELLDACEGVGEEDLWQNLAYFLERVGPVAEEAGVKLAIHPDDPPWPVFDLPRIVTSAAALERVTELAGTPANGVCLCTGSLGADPDEAEALPRAARRLGGRVHFAHLRNVRATGEKRFHETPHPSGDVDLAAVVRALRESGFDGPLRPDHGRMIWGEEDRPNVRPGYGLYDRALGANYLLGLWEREGERA